MCSDKGQSEKPKCVQASLSHTIASPASQSCDRQLATFAISGDTFGDHLKAFRFNKGIKIECPHVGSFYWLRISTLKELLTGVFHYGNDVGRGMQCPI